MRERNGITQSSTSRQVRTHHALASGRKEPRRPHSIASDERGAISYKMAKTIAGLVIALAIGFVAAFIIRGPLADWLDSQLGLIGIGQSSQKAATTAVAKTGSDASVFGRVNQVDWPR